MTLLETFIFNLKTERIKQRLSQEQLAEKCKLHRTYISYLECGKRNPSIETLDKIAKGLGIVPTQLLINKEDT